MPLELVLEGKPKPEEPVMLGAVTRSKPVVLVSEAESLPTVALAPNMPPFGVAFEMPLLEAVAFESNRLRDKDPGVSLLGDTASEVGTIPNVDRDCVVPNILLLGGGCVDALLIGAEIEPNTPSLRDSKLLGGSNGGDPMAHLLLLGTLLVEEDPKPAKPGTPDFISAPLVPVSPLFSAVVPAIPVVRAAEALAMPFSLYILGCIKGFTAHVCVLNSSS